MPVRLRLPAPLLVLSLMLTACGAASANAQQVSTFGPIVTGGPSPTGQPPAVVTVTPPAAATSIPATTAAPPTVAPPAATAAATSQATTTPLPKLNHDLMGIQAYGYAGPNDWGQMMDRAFFMGFKWMKLQLSWKELEPAKGQYTPQFDILHANVGYTTVFRSGALKVMLSIAKAPDWARPKAAQKQSDGPPTNPQDLIDFLNHFLQNVDVSKIGAIEIWNEPNTTTEWTGAPITGASYMSLFTPVYKALRAQYPNLVIITGGPGPAGPVNDRQWLQQLYDAGLPKNDPNLVIGVHPYGWANPPDARCCVSHGLGWDNNKAFYFLDTIYDYHDIMVKNGHNGKLWVTEFGWSAFKGLRAGSHVDGPPAMPPSDPGVAWMAILDDQQQANYIVRAFQIAQTGDLANLVGPMFLWNLNFAALPGYTQSDKPSLPDSGFSVLNADTFPRPAYVLLQAIADQK